MKPDRTNYEIWLIDYLDGTLDSESQRELFLFLDENSDIREEFSDILNYRIAPSRERHFDKNSLKRSAEDLSELQFEMMCVAASENDLNKSQRSEFEEMILSSPEKRKTAKEISKIKLVPPEAVFRYKSRLKKLTIPQKIFRYSVMSISAAAAVLIFVTIIRKPVSTVPGNQIQITSRDKVLKENVIVEQTEKTILKQPVLVSENINPETEKKEGKNPLMTKSDSEVLFVSGEEDTTLQQEFVRSIEISKIDYRSSVPFGNYEISQTLIALNLNPVTDLTEGEKPGFNESIAKFFREKILKSKTPEKGSLRAYEIADAGINGLNRLFGWEMSLEKNTDEKGEVNSVYFNSRLLKFNAPVKKSEPLE